ncbi:hypothetical protein H2199_009235 [Coniosporium tulheliwenetii]|uniref:Uncharacterized protein n=1 Tax=Coniosporium tulheliwenetii TaxID=3383036 RepID=A0ACC2YF43_9PEZI|nr:hypothetical protein H2199_009235 [Cladosporium sp. JES 115]
MLSSVVLVLTYSRSVISKVSHGTSFFANFTKSLAFAIRHPRRYFISSQFTLLFLVYFGTFSTANIIDTVSSTSNAKPASTVTTGVSKLLATSAVSTGLCVYKDSCFTKMFGRRNIGLAVPKASYALFTLRDIATVYGCFILPPVVSKKLANLPDGVKERFSYFVHTEAARDKTAQMMLPAAIQLVSTPIHLLALDLNNHQWRLGGDPYIDPPRGSPKAGGHGKLYSQASELAEKESPDTVRFHLRDIAASRQAGDEKNEVTNPRKLRRFQKSGPEAVPLVEMSDRIKEVVSP